MNATCGRRCAELLPNCGPIGCLGKMLLASSIWGSTKRFLTWQKAGYAVLPFVFPACGIGAWHERQRTFIIAADVSHAPCLRQIHLQGTRQTWMCSCRTMGSSASGNRDGTIWSLSLSAGGVLPDAGGVGGLPLHPETGGLPGQVPVQPTFRPR